MNQQLINMGPEGVAALKSLAASLPEAVSSAKAACTELHAVYEDNQNTLGPHIRDIEDIIETVKEAQSKGNKSVVSLQLSLIKSAAILQEIINEKLNP